MLNDEGSVLPSTIMPSRMRLPSMLDKGGEAPPSPAAMGAEERHARNGLPQRTARPTAAAAKRRRRAQPASLLYTHFVR